MCSSDLVVGPTGCGKSTLLNIGAGLLAPSRGSLRVFGQPLQGINTRAGYMFQSDALMPWRSALDNVMLGLQYRGVPEVQARAQAQGWLQRVGLGEFGDRYPHQLSGGMRKRTALAQVLALDPDIILMDEPFGALDALTREKMNLEMLRIWGQSRKTFVLVTHSIQEAVFLGSRCAVLTAGPARMADFFAIDLPEPRKLHIKATPLFGEYVTRIYDLLGVE